MELDERPRLLAPTKCQIGEGPLWHPKAKALFFTDIAGCVIHRYDPETVAHREFSRGPTTGAMTLQEDGTLLLYQDGRISAMDREGKQRVLASGLCPGNERFNDVIADPEGRVFAGTLGGNGKLYRFDLNGKQTQLLDGLGVPNGMGFTPDLKGMYFTDSVPRKIYRFDYDRATGALTNQRVFTEIPKEEGVPDGMAIDAEGGVWTAVWFGGRLKRFTPDGKLEREIHFPVRQTSALAFGGADGADIFVTTAGTDLADSMRPPGHDLSAPRGGGLYGLRLKGIRGRPQFNSRVRFK